MRPLVDASSSPRPRSRGSRSPRGGARRRAQVRHLRQDPDGSALPPGGRERRQLLRQGGARPPGSSATRTCSASRSRRRTASSPASPRPTSTSTPSAPSSRPSATSRATTPSRPSASSRSRSTSRARDLFLKGLDLRIGNQIVLWGVADQFNPTNNLNSRRSARPAALRQAAAELHGQGRLLDHQESSRSRACWCPSSSRRCCRCRPTLGAADIQRMPFVDDTFRHPIESQFGFAASTLGYPTIVRSLTPVLPGPSADNMQFAFRLAGTLGEQDIALSYYLGRTDFPQPFSNHTSQVNGVRCDPNAPHQLHQRRARHRRAPHLPADARLRPQHERRVQPLQVDLRVDPRPRLPHRGRADRPPAHHPSSSPRTRSPRCSRAPASTTTRAPATPAASRRRRRRHALRQVDARPRLHLRRARLRQRAVGPRPRRRVRRRRLPPPRRAAVRAPAACSHHAACSPERPAASRRHERHPVRRRRPSPPASATTSCSAPTSSSSTTRPSSASSPSGPSTASRRASATPTQKKRALTALLALHHAGLLRRPSTRSSTTTSATASSSARARWCCSAHSYHQVRRPGRGRVGGFTRGRYSF